MIAKNRCLALLASLFWFCTVCGDPISSLEPLNSGWEYSWISAPTDSFDSPSWQPYDVRGPRPDHGNHRFLRIRRTFARLSGPEPFLYIPGVDQMFTVHAENRELYTFGELKSKARSFPGFRRGHFICLSGLKPGTTLYLTVFADWSNIGLAGIPLLGQRKDVYEYDLVREADLLFFFALFLVCSGVSFFFLLLRPREPMVVHFGLITLCSAILIFTHTHLKFQIWDKPMFWALAATTTFLLPVFLNEFFRRAFWPQHTTFFRLLRYGFLLFLGVALATLGLLGLTRFYCDWVTRPFVLFSGLSTASILGLSLRNALGPAPERRPYSRPIVVGLVGLLILSLPHFLYELHWINIHIVRVHWGLAFFILCLSWVVGLHLREIHREKLRLEEEQHRNRLAAENAVARSRERIMADLHDQLGSLITDLSLWTTQALKAKADGRAALLEMARITESVRARFRDLVDQASDEQMIARDFVPGLHVHLLRRYSVVGRPLVYEADPEINLDGALRSDLVSIVDEICTNDLKYGAGEVLWRLHAKDSILKVQLRTQSLYPPETTEGLGRHSLRMRIEKWGGKLDVAHFGSIYVLEFIIPVRPPGQG